MTSKRAQRGLWTGLMVILAIATPLAGQDPDPRLERIRSQLPEATVERIEARIQTAREAGLPVEPLLDKAVEGIAKRVPGPRIAGAVDQLAGELGRAQTLLMGGVPPTPTDVAAVADAMRRGVPEQAIRRIAQGGQPGEPIAMAVHTMGDLMDRGVPVDQAVAVLEAWRGRGARGDELRELPGAVERLDPPGCAARPGGRGRGQCHARRPAGWSRWHERAGARVAGRAADPAGRRPAGRPWQGQGKPPNSGGGPPGGGT